ncbi:hypothetical protein KGM_215201A, partial [Danaus plexippus plexippus]
MDRGYMSLRARKPPEGLKNLVFKMSLSVQYWIAGVTRDNGSFARIRLSLRLV